MYNSGIHIVWVCPRWICRKVVPLHIGRCLWAHTRKIYRNSNASKKVATRSATRRWSNVGTWHICFNFTAYIYIRGEFYNEASNLQLAIKEVSLFIEKNSNKTLIQRWYMVGMVGRTSQLACQRSPHVGPTWATQPLGWYGSSS
jgi:hypothetical protein